MVSRTPSPKAKHFRGSKVTGYRSNQQFEMVHRVGGAKAKAQGVAVGPGVGVPAISRSASSYEDICSSENEELELNSTTKQEPRICCFGGGEFDNSARASKKIF